MGIMDNVKDKMGDMGDEAKQRLQMLKDKEKDGTLDDKGRQELTQLRSRFENHGGQ